MNTKNYKLHIFGKGSHIYRGLSPDIKTYGFVENIEPIFETGDIFIHPIEDGAGINVKVAENIYNGKPLIATRYALRGLPDVILKDPAIVAVEDIYSMKNVLENESLIRHLRKKKINKELAELFSLEENIHKLKHFLKTLGVNLSEE